MSKSTRVLFVCLHGSAKSVIAAHMLLLKARDIDLDVEVDSAGVEADASIPQHVVAGLRRAGVDVGEQRPKALTDDTLTAADLVVSFGCELALAPGDRRARRLLRWDDVPAVSDDFDRARDDIERRLDTLLLELQ